MIIPKPEIGMVISYEVLWYHEADKGQLYGRKDRPSVIVLNMEDDNGKTKVIVAPITHYTALDSLPECRHNNFSLSRKRLILVF